MEHIIKIVIKGMNPESHLILNLDRKTLPFPGDLWKEEHKNYSEPVNFVDIKTYVNMGFKTRTH